MLPRNFSYLHTILFLILALSLAACGGGTEPTAPVEPPASLTPQAGQPETPAAPGVGEIFARNPSYSSPIVISDDDALLLAVNSLDGTISAFNVQGDANQKVAEFSTGDQPRSVVISPDKKLAYVTNQGSATLSVIDLALFNKIVDIPVGVEPYGVAQTPDGRRLYVANSASGTVSVVDAASQSVVASIPIPGVQPRGVAVTNNNGGAGPQFVYVTQFLSQPSASGGPGLDQGSEGKVFVLSTADDSQIQGVITLSPRDAGFAADRTKFGGGAEEVTFAYPNQLQSVVLKNGRGYLPNIAASPEGPVKFNVDTQAFVSVFDVQAKSELPGGTINLQAAVKAQTFKPKLFFANPWAVAFEHASNEGYVVSAGSDAVVKINLDENGVPSAVLLPAEGDTNRVFFIEVGSNPRGAAANNADTRLYVLNYLSKNVSVIDLTQSPEAEIARLTSHDLPAAGSDAEKFLLGNYLFNTSRGTFDEGVAERMSSDGWQSCASCHPDGLTDGVIWQFPAGPRKSVALNGTFSPASPDTNQRVLNYSAIFDEIEDFELNIRNVSGGQGLIVVQGGSEPEQNVKAFDPPNAGRTQLHVGGIGAWDAIVAWVKLRVPSPISPLRGADPGSELGQKIAIGRELFTEANCQSCHGGPKWSTNQVDFARTSPFPETLTAGVEPEAPLAQLARFLKNVSTFDPSLPVERTAANQQALGAAGFNPPSLLSIWAFPPYLHNGACQTLACVLENETHRNAGGTDLLDDPVDQDALLQFLFSIDASTESVNP